MNVEAIVDQLLALKQRADHDLQVQDYLSKAELPEGLEYVKPELTGRRGGYFRKKPGRDSSKQLEHRLKFANVASTYFGKKGVTVLNDGRVITKAAEAIGDDLRGTGIIRRERERDKLIQMLKSEETTAKRVHASWI